jgi:hypothetical protein
MLVEIFYHIDEFCKVFEATIKLEEKNEIKKRKPRCDLMSLSEIMTICIYYNYSGYKNFKEYYTRLIQQSMRHEFSKVVSYNRFVELKSNANVALFIFLKIYCGSQEYVGICYIDSCAVKVCNNKRISSHKVFKELAQRGQTSMGWFYGFKVHLIIDSMGQIINFYVTAGNVADNNHNLLEKLTQNIVGKIFGDKGYLLNPSFYQKLYNRGAIFITKVRKNMQNRVLDFIDKILLKKRGIIESSIGILKNFFNLEHSRHRSPKNFISHTLSTLVAYCFKPSKPSIASRLCFAA